MLFLYILTFDYVDSTSISIREYEQALNPGSKLALTFKVLRSKQECCRNHSFRGVKTTQIAGSGGIKGLKRGSTVRPGLEIVSTRKFCKHCDKTTIHDKWTGEFIPQIPGSELGRSVQKQILEYFNNTDVIFRSQRVPKNLTIDHKLPRIRWPFGYERADKNPLTDAQIQKRFQLFKSRSHRTDFNLLKSRACEHCLKTKERGTPFGINFFYKGDGHWGSFEENDERGCEGCGWYDFAKWRDELNLFIERHSA